MTSGPVSQIDANLLRPAIVVLMVGIVMYAFVILLQLFVPGWSGSYVLAIGMFAAAEGYFSRRVLTPHGWYLGANLRLRLAEAIFLFLLLQVGARIMDGRWFLGDWPEAGPVMISITVMWLVFLCWLAGFETAQDLTLMAFAPEDRGGEDANGRLVRRYAAGGALLLSAAGIAKMGLLQLLRPAGDVALLVFSVLVYFVLGVLLLGNVHYTSLRVAWARQDRAVAPAMGSRWLRLSLFFMGLVALIVFLLPTGYTTGLLELLGYGLSLIISLGAYLFALLLYLVSLLLQPIVNLLRGDETGAAQEPPIPPEMAPPPTEGNGEWFQVAQSLLFWAVVAILAISMIRTYVWQNKRLAAFLAAIKPLAWLMSRIGSIWRRLAGLSEEARKRLRRRRRKQALKRQAAGGGRTRRADTLRDQVRAHYLRTLDHAGERGWPRKPPETPYEYNKSLAPHVREARDDLAALTDIFVEASYSPRSPGADAVAEARDRAERIEAAIEPPGTAPPEGKSRTRKAQ